MDVAHGWGWPWLTHQADPLYHQEEVSGHLLELCGASALRALAHMLELYELFRRVAAQAGLQREVGCAMGTH